MNNELMHYGVIGMRWGIRKAEKRGTDYHYKSFGQKQYEKKVNKLQSKGKDASKAQAKLDTFKKRDEGRERYARSTTAGRQLAKTLLLGAVGNGTYNRMRSSGQGRAVSFVAGLATSYVPVLGIGLSKMYENEQASRKRKG